MSFRVKWRRFAARYLRAIDRGREWPRCWHNAARAITGFVGSLLDWGLGIDLRYGTGASGGGTQSITSLVGAVLVIVGGLISFVRGQEERNEALWPYLVLYLLLSSLPMAGIIAILRAAKPDERNRFRHLFDEGAVMYGRTCLIGSLVVVSVVFSFCWAQTIPGQADSRYTLPVSGVERHEFKFDSPDLDIKKSDAGFVALFPVYSSTYKELGSPDPLVIELRLGSLVREDWQITDVVGLVTGTSEPLTLDPPVLLDTDDPNIKKVIWPHLVKKTSYTLRVYLHPKQQEKVTPDMREIFRSKEPEGLTARCRYRK